MTNNENEIRVRNVLEGLRKQLEAILGLFPNNEKLSNEEILSIQAEYVRYNRNLDTFVALIENLGYSINISSLALRVVDDKHVSSRIINIDNIIRNLSSIKKAA